MEELFKVIGLAVLIPAVPALGFAGSAAWTLLVGWLNSRLVGVVLETPFGDVVVGEVERKDFNRAEFSGQLSQLLCPGARLTLRLLSRRDYSRWVKRFSSWLGPRCARIPVSLVELGELLQIRSEAMIEAVNAEQRAEALAALPKREAPPSKELVAINALATALGEQAEVRAALITVVAQIREDLEAIRSDARDAAKLSARAAEAARQRLRVHADR